MFDPKAKSTPLAATTYRVTHGSERGIGSLAAERENLSQYRAAVVEDMAHKAVRVEPEEFLKEFLRSNNDESPHYDYNVFKDVEGAKTMTEARVADKFIMAVNLLNLAPGFKLAESKNKPDMGEVSKQKIDASFFRGGRLPVNSSVDRPNWAEQAVSVEFKSHDTKNDPFDDRTDGKVDADALDRKKVRGQLITYAEKVFEYQHRTALFMLIVIGRRFRFIRWDRSGAIVTRAVDYFERPDLLCEMLWHMAHLTDEQLGMDPTAIRIRPGDDDYKKMDVAGRPNAADFDHKERGIDELPQYDQEFRYVREAFCRSLERRWPRYRLDVPDGPGTRSFLVGKPAFQAAGMAGRGTRGYVALDCQSGRFVWLKDAWRAHYDLVETEGSVLETLNKEGVCNVPTLMCHGDILEQSTKTPDYWPKKKDPETTAQLSSALLSSAPPDPLVTCPASPATSSGSSAPSSPCMPASHLQPSSHKTAVKRSRSEVEDEEESATLPEECPLRRHMHYRLVVKEVAMDLTTFKDGQQLLSIIFDCIMAHYQATTKAKIIHRDISGGNILIFPKATFDQRKGRKFVKWFGLLADWEMSKPIYEKPSLSRARQPERTGTWQYMSAAALSDHSKIIGTPDELESFFYVLLYNSVRYLKSNCIDAGSFIEQFFDTYTVCEGTYKCGLKKEAAIISGDIVETSEKFVSRRLRFSSPLDTFFAQALGWFQAHYIVEAYRAEHAPPPTLSTPPSASITSPSPQSPRRSKPEEYTYYDMMALAPAAVIPDKVTVKVARKPTPAEEENALRVATHAHVLRALHDAIYSDDWRAETDRADGDNVPPDFSPNYEVGPRRGASTATCKRRRLAKTAAAGPYEDEDEEEYEDVYPLRNIVPGATPRTPRRGNMKHSASALV